MKKLDLNIDNLFLLWEADNCKSEFLDVWMKNNKDLLFDFENEIIYTGLNKFFKDIEVFGELEKQDLLDAGHSIDEVNLRFDSLYDKQVNVLSGLFPNIRLEDRGGLYIELILKMRDQFYKERSTYLDNKIDLLINPDTINKKTKPLQNGHSETSCNNICIDEQVNPHPQIFINGKAYQLFQKLFEAYKASNFKLADFSFIYRAMHKDQLILNSFKPQMFIDWINNEPYNISLVKIKTMDNCTTGSKIQNYNTIKEVLQIK